MGSRIDSTIRVAAGATALAGLALAVVWRAGDRRGALIAALFPGAYALW